MSLDPTPLTESASINTHVIALGVLLVLASVIIVLLVILFIVRTKQLQAKQTK